MKKGVVYKLLGVLICLLLVGGAFATGHLKDAYKATIGKERINTNTEKFEHNKSYIHGMIQDLSKLKLQYATADEKEKLAIKNHILEQYTNFDSKLIEDDSLRSFFLELRNAQ